jgi:hypothetical protein
MPSWLVALLGAAVGTHNVRLSTEEVAADLERAEVLLT